jgi:hypothetical protein
MADMAGLDRTRALPARLADGLVLAAACAFSVLVTFKSGMRGFYPFDQSIVFDGAYRVASGQVPYRDFVMPFGPMAFWLQAPFFKILGVSYWSYVCGSAVIGALAVLASAGLVRLLFPADRILSYLAALLTAVWFYAPFGTPWVDQTAFFFSYLGIVALLAGVLPSSRGTRQRNLLCALAGVAAFASILSKQNAGAFMLPGYLLVIAAAGTAPGGRPLRRLVWFGIGLAAGAVVFSVWLVGFSSPANFWENVIGLASTLGRERLRAFVAVRFGLSQTYFGDRPPLAVSLALIASLVVAVAALILAWRQRRSGADGHASLMPASVLCIYLVLFQHVYMNTTLNQQENALAFLGPIVALAGSLVLAFGGWPSEKRRLLALAVWTVTAIAVAFATAEGVKVSMDRKVHDIFRGDSFGRPISVEGLKGLRWAEPMRLRGFDIFEEDFLALVTYLRGRGDNFLIFPDFTILYGLAGVPSPQPLLWFHEGVTYRKGRTSGLDAWIVRDLERNRVKVVVIEQVAWYNTGERLEDFPKLRDYIYGNFTRLGQIGTFSVYERALPIK